MKSPRRLFPFGCLLIALLIALLFPGWGKSDGFASCRPGQPVTISAYTETDNNQEEEKHICVIDLPGDTQPYILQQNTPLHLCNGESRSHTPSPGGLQYRHIRLFHTFCKTLHGTQAIRQSLLRSDGYFFYGLCRMLM